MTQELRRFQNGLLFTMAMVEKNVMTGSIAANNHRFEPNAVATSANRSPNAHITTQPLKFRSGSNGKWPMNLSQTRRTQNSKEQEMLRQPIKFPNIPRLIVCSIRYTPRTSSVRHE